MNYAQVLALIQQWIMTNRNNEITANVLRPILEEMLQQPNDLIGDLDNLETSDKSSVVAAINEILSTNIAASTALRAVDTTGINFNQSELFWVRDAINQTIANTGDITANIGQMIVFFIDVLLSDDDDRTAIIQRRYYRLTTGESVVSTIPSNIKPPLMPDGSGLVFIDFSDPDIVVDLGNIGTNNLWDAFNSDGEQPFEMNDDNFVVAIQDGIQKVWKWVGGTGSFGNSATPSVSTGFMDLTDAANTPPSDPFNYLPTKTIATTPYTITPDDLNRPLIFTSNNQVVNAPTTLIDEAIATGSGLTLFDFKAYFEGTGTHTVNYPDSEVWAGGQGALIYAICVDTSGDTVWVVKEWEGEAPTGLEALDEGSGIGWRLIGRDPDNFGNIGLDAIDFSQSSFPSAIRGATGVASFAKGINTIASGTASSAEGNGCQAIGEFSHAEGNVAFANGQNSHAEGLSSQANGNSSHAEGSNTIASGNRSHAEGFNTEASGHESHAGGVMNRARAAAETSIGRYGTDYVPADDGTDRLLNVGNGEDGFNLSDAFTLFRNGAIRIFRATLASITNAASGFLIGNSDDNNRPYYHNGTEWKGLAYVDETQYVNATFLGLIGDDSTNNFTALQSAINFCSINNLTLFFPNGTYLVNNASSPIEIPNSINIVCDKNVFIRPTATASTNTLFSLKTDIPSTAEISIKGLKTIGLTRTRFISTQNGTPSSRLEIKSIRLENLQLGSHPILIDFNCSEEIYVDGIKGGVGLSLTDVSAFSFSITADTSGDFTGERVYVNNVYAWAGNQDIDMFFLKARNYNDVFFGNLIAHSLVKTTGGVDADGVGKHVIFSNIKTINCPFEIKETLTLMETYNIQASNITVINGSCTLKAAGNYNNISVYDEIGTSLFLSGYAPTDGTTREDTFINISNVNIINAGSKTSSASPINFGRSNVNLKNVNISHTPDVIDIIPVPAIRLSDSITNVRIENIYIKGYGSAYNFANSRTFSKIELLKTTLENADTRIVTTSDNTEFFDVIIDTIFLINYSGATTSAFQFRASMVFERTKFLNWPANIINVIATHSTFEAHSRNVWLGEDFILDRNTTTGNFPANSVDYQMGTKVLVAVDNKLYMKVSTSATPTTAFILLN